MASIYDYTSGDTITEGLQGSDVSDQAIQTAQQIAAERGDSVLLDDDDGQWVVRPDGMTLRHDAAEESAHAMSIGG